MNDNRINPELLDEPSQLINPDGSVSPVDPEEETKAWAGAELAKIQREQLAEQEKAGIELAEVALASDDFVRMAQLLHGKVPMALWIAFCDALELCPDHVCDSAICADDRLGECEAGQVEPCGRSFTMGSAHDPYGVSCDLPEGHDGPHQGDHPLAEDERIGWTGGGSVAGDPLPVKLLGQCAWFALCDRPATLLVDHPVLGRVPSCERCQKVVGR